MNTNRTTAHAQVFSCALLLGKQSLFTRQSLAIPVYNNDWYVASVCQGVTSTVRLLWTTLRQLSQTDKANRMFSAHMRTIWILWGLNLASDTDDHAIFIWASQNPNGIEDTALGWLVLYLPFKTKHILKLVFIPCLWSTTRFSIYMLPLVL